MKLKNPVMFYLVFIFILINLVDITTALFSVSAEANPIALLFDSMVVLFVLKIALSLFLIFMYRRNIYPTNFTYYALIVFVTLGCLLFAIGVYSNVIGILNPDQVAEAAQIPAKEKAIAYAWFVGLFYMIPCLFSLLSFWLYEKSYKHTKIDYQYYKRKRWWQL